MAIENGDFALSAASDVLQLKTHRCIFQLIITVIAHTVPLRVILRQLLFALATSVTNRLGAALAMACWIGFL